MPPGRPPETVEAHDRKGTFRKDRHGARGVSGLDAPARPPQPPAWLEGYAKTEWRRVVPQLWRAGLVRHVDRAALACYCQAYADLRASRATIRREGRTFKTPSGQIKKHPAVGIAHDAMTQIRAFSIEYGLTAAARSRIRGVGQSESKSSSTNPVDELKQRVRERLEKLRASDRTRRDRAPAS